jgi:hypothetical protein
VSCALIPGAIGTFDGSTPLPLELRANMSLTAGVTTPYIQVSLPAAGSTESFGSVQWTDGSTTFNWIEGSSPLLTGTRFQ